MSDNKKIVSFRFDASDIDLGVELDCFVQLFYLEPDSILPPPVSVASGEISKSFILRLIGDADDADIADLTSRISSFFLNYHAVQLDSDSILEFLSTINKFIYTPFVRVFLEVRSRS